jgi:hypothetical protein
MQAPGGRGWYSCRRPSAGWVPHCGKDDELESTENVSRVHRWQMAHMRFANPGDCRLWCLETSPATRDTRQTGEKDKSSQVKILRTMAMQKIEQMCTVENATRAARKTAVLECVSPSREMKVEPKTPENGKFT